MMWGTIRSGNCQTAAEQGADICHQCRLLQEPVEFLTVTQAMSGGPNLKTLHSDVLFLEGHVLLLKHIPFLLYFSVHRQKQQFNHQLYILSSYYASTRCFAERPGQLTAVLLAVLTVCSNSNLEVVNLLRLLPSTLAILCAHHPLKSTSVYVCTVHYPQCRIWMTLCLSKYVILLSCL